MDDNNSDIKIYILNWHDNNIIVFVTYRLLVSIITKLFKRPKKSLIVFCNHTLTNIK